MASMIPAFATAIQDHQLRGHARDVYIWMHEHLDVVEFRTVKNISVQEDLQMSATHVRWSISRLLEFGYLAEGPRDGRLRTYRLYYSRPWLPPIGETLAFSR